MATLPRPTNRQTVFVGFSLLGPATLFLLALALRLHRLGAESLFMDELHQVSNYAAPLAHLPYGAAVQGQPPLDYLIGFLVARISNSDFAVRLPAALFGSGAVLLLFMLCQRVAGRTVALGCGLLAAILPFNIYFSQEARPYAIAVFFLLALLHSLLRLLEGEARIPWRAALFFGGMTVCFLYSRTLAPLMTCLALALILIGMLAAARYKPDPIDAGFRQRLRWALAIMFMAGMLYLPVFVLIYQVVGGDLARSASGGTGWLCRLASLDFRPFWGAFLVQSEPIGYLLLALISAIPLAGHQARPEIRLPLALVAWLLPSAALLDLVAFKLASNLPFRPPYATYLLPLSLVLAAAAFQTLWDLSLRSRFRRPARLVLLALAGLALVCTTRATLAAKEMSRKPDWRGICAYLAANYGAKTVLLFDSLAPAGGWEPTFYGFPRYYRGTSPQVAVADLPSQLVRFRGEGWQPVLILFQGRGYRLTPDSPDDFLPPFNPAIPAVHFAAISSDDRLAVKEMTGFSIIRPGKSTGNFAGDTATILAGVLDHLPSGESSRRELEAAAIAVCAEHFVPTAPPPGGPGH